MLTTTTIARQAVRKADVSYPTVSDAQPTSLLPWATSSYPDGTKLHPQHPTVAVMAPSTVTPTSTLPSEDASKEGQELKDVRMLVVDDSIPVLKMMCESLREYGALITQARDGQEAVSLCESVVLAGGQDFSVILTDIQMPNLDGLGEVRFVRAMEKELGLKPKIIVGISAYYVDRLARKAMEAGMDAFLPKPFKYERFKEAIDDVVQRRNNIAEQGIGTEKNALAETHSVLGCKPLQQPVVTVPIVATLGSRIFPEA